MRDTGRIYTIGHGGKTTSDLLCQLQRNHIQFVIDVRSSPYSRFQPEFSQEPLQGFLARHGIRYVFMGDDLGGRPKDPDCYTDGRVDYRKCEVKPFFRHGLERLRSAHRQGLRVCLLCSEAQPSQCHRSKLVGAALTAEGIDVLHLLPDGSSRTQAEVIHALTNGQGDLFGEHFLSRKAYR